MSDYYGAGSHQPYGGDPYGQPGYGAPGYGGYGGYGAPAGPPPDNNLVWGILATVLCCLPLGVVSIVKANEVNTLWAQGQYEAAHESARQAKKYAVWSAVTTVGLVVLGLTLGVVLELTTEPSTS